LTHTVCMYKPVGTQYNFRRCRTVRQLWKVAFPLLLHSKKTQQIRRILYSINSQFDETAKYGFYLLTSWLYSHVLVAWFSVHFAWEFGGCDCGYEHIPWRTHACCGLKEESTQSVKFQPFGGIKMCMLWLLLATPWPWNDIRRTDMPTGHRRQTWFDWLEGFIYLRTFSAVGQLVSIRYSTRLLGTTAEWSG